MHATLHLATLIPVLSSATTDTQSYFPTTHVRSLATKAFREARATVIADRKLQFNDASIGESMASMMPFICALLGSQDSRDGYAQEMAANAVTCSDFGCDDPGAATPNLVMNCRADGELCEDGLRRRLGDDGRFCIADAEVRMSMGLDFMNESNVTSTQCSTYTSPRYMADMGRGCWTIHALMDLSAVMGGIASGEMDPTTMTEEESANARSEYVENIECSGAFDDGTKCTCATCEGRLEFKFACDNNLISDECAVFDTADIGAIAEGDAKDPSISVIRMAAAPDAGDAVKESDASHASGETAEMAATPGAGDAVKEPNTSHASGETVETSLATARRGASAVSGSFLAFVSFLALV